MEIKMSNDVSHPRGFCRPINRALINTSGILTHGISQKEQQMKKIRTQTHQRHKKRALLFLLFIFSEKRFVKLKPTRENEPQIRLVQSGAGPCLTDSGSVGSRRVVGGAYSLPPPLRKTG